MNGIFALRSKLVVFCLLLAVSRSVLAATYVITSTGDRMPTNATDFVPGTLRGAILMANTNASRDTITFASGLLNAWGATRISLVAPLPHVIHPIVLDAAPDDPLGRRPPSIEITPVTAPMVDDGLRLPSNSILRGVALFGFLRQLALSGSSNLVESCYLGCSSDGEPGAFHDSATGVSLAGEYNRVIHCTVAGNGSHGIVLETAGNCEVLDNYVGPLPGGDVLGNGGAGITLDIARTNIIGRAPFRGNFIAGNLKGGILLGSRFPDFSTRGTVIEANVLGLLLAGRLDSGEGPPGNGSHGIVINQQRQITIRHNQIHASHGDGILLIGSSVISTWIEGNFIGNGGSGSGVHVFLGSQNVITNNEISGSRGHGLHLDSASVNQVIDNRLTGNGRGGVYLQGPDSAFSQTAGNVVRGNDIGENGGPGIVQHGNARQNLFIENAIFNNGGLGIDLGGTNETEAIYSPVYDSMFTNGFSRGDGPNYVRNEINVYPYQLGVTLTNVTLSNSVVRAGGYFLTTAQDALVSGGLYLLHFHASDAGDPSGFGEGEELVGTFLVGPIPSFDASTNFLATFTNASLALGDLITATVTRTNNSTTANQTSEFSNFIPLRAPGVSNRPPVAIGDIVTTLEDVAVEFAVKANDFDLDGDPITVESVTIDKPAFGLSQILGSVTLLPDQTIRFVPAANLNNRGGARVGGLLGFLGGPVNIRYVINDGRGLKATGSAAVDILPVNDPPQAFPDLATTPIDIPVTIQVRANDRDVDGDPLTIISTTPAGHGTVVINAGKSVTYTPAPGYAGRDTFGYGISDGAGGLADSDVTILVRDTSARTDLGVTQTVTPIAATTNAPVMFHLVVTNAGPLDAPGVVLQAGLSSHARVSSLGSSQGSRTNLLNRVRFDFGLVPAGAGATATIAAASENAGEISSSARVLSLIGDAFPQNDRATTSIAITDGREPSLTITRLADRIRLSWDASAGAFSPEYRLDLGAGTPWRRLSGPTSTSGGQVHMDILEPSLVSEPFLAFRLLER